VNGWKEGAFERVKWIKPAFSSLREFLSKHVGRRFRANALATLGLLYNSYKKRSISMCHATKAIFQHTVLSGKAGEESSFLIV